MPKQVPLHFEFPGTQGFDQYYAGANANIVQNLRNCASGSGEALIFLWGGNGLGKTHLLQACCQLAHHSQLSASYLPLSEWSTRDPALLEGLENLHLLCIDDIQTVAGNCPWEHAIFNLFNRSRELGHRIIITAPQPPRQIKMELADLHTRLGWGLTLGLKALDDTAKLAALIQRANNLGFELPPQVGRFLLTRQPRDMPTLWRLLDDLEQATLAAQRKLTIPFLKSYLQNLR